MGDNKKYAIVENSRIKMLRSENYSYDFNKETGFFARWGKTKDDDPQFSPFGPEILDIEISVDGCPDACTFCLPEGVPINTPDGLKNIEDIKVGDKVLGYDFSNNNTEEQEVVEVHTRKYKGYLIIIELDDGRIIELTEDHRVMLSNGKEVLAKDLTKEDDVVII